MHGITYPGAWEMKRTLEEAKSAQDRVALKLTPEELACAEKIVRDWRPQKYNKNETMIRLENRTVYSF